MLKKWSNVVVIHAGFALESGNHEIMKMMNKKIEVRCILWYSLYHWGKAGVIVQISVIFGYPIETKETIKETFDQCLKCWHIS